MTNTPYLNENNVLRSKKKISNGNNTSTGGLYSSNSHEIKEKQMTTAKILEEIKKYLDKSELPKLLGVFKEVKECDTIEPVFKKLKNVFFGNVMAPSRATDKNFREKIRCLEDLGTLIPKKLQDEYRMLMSDL